RLEQRPAQEAVRRLWGLQQLQQGRGEVERVAAVGVERGRQAMERVAHQQRDAVDEERAEVAAGDLAVCRLRVGGMVGGDDEDRVARVRAAVEPVQELPE